MRSRVSLTEVSGRRQIFLATAALLGVLAFVAAGCGSTKKSSSGTTTAATSCANKDDLNLKTVDQLTIGTDNPAYDPWFSGGTPKGSTWKFNDPTTQKGYESAVAYAIAKQLGFTPAQVKWVVVPFEQIFKPGPKSYDFDVNQVSVTPARKKSVTFSDSYYNTNQALVAIKGSPITKAKTIADLKKYKLGAQVGTTSYDYIVNNIKPDQQPAVYNNSNDVNSGAQKRRDRWDRRRPADGVHHRRRRRGPEQRRRRQLPGQGRRRPFRSGPREEQQPRQLR